MLFEWIGRNLLKVAPPIENLRSLLSACKQTAKSWLGKLQNKKEDYNVHRLRIRSSQFPKLFKDRSKGTFLHKYDVRTVCYGYSYWEKSITKMDIFFISRRFRPFWVDSDFIWKMKGRGEGGEAPNLCFLNRPNNFWCVLFALYNLYLYIT